MIGNDVVDLNLARSGTNWRRKGYLQKLFTAPEVKIILNSSNPHKELWLLWAMKEATYKAHQRRFNLPRSYNPTMFICEIGERNKNLVIGKVSIGNFRYFTKTSVKGDYLHCISSAEKKLKFLHQILLGSGKSATALLDQIAKLKGLPKEKLYLEKNSNFIPEIYVENQILNESFSLSHHGKFSAYTVALMNY